MDAGIVKAQERVREILEAQLERVERIKNEGEPTDYSALSTLRIGLIGGDGIGPLIMEEARRVLDVLLADKIAQGQVELVDIKGLTLENRLAAGKALPEEVLKEIKSCHVLLKGPTTTPEKGDQHGQNIESANVAMRKALDLFANVRPVRIPEKNIDWIFFRENTEDAYAVGSQGLDVNDDLALDFKIITTPGTERIARMAFDHAKTNGRTRVSAVTKANIIKATDGKFLNICQEMSKEYPSVEFDSWYIDIMTANLVNPKLQSSFQVLVMPNLYGDILTDEAAEIQGGVGTAGSANIGTKYAMFEAIHGSAPRMFTEKREQYADPISILRAAAMLLSHVGYVEEAEKLTEALDFSTREDSPVKVTGYDDGATSGEMADYILVNLKR